MAKSKYTAPMFKFCPIPLDAAGTGGGCALPETQGQYQCAIEDPFFGSVLFMDKSYGCERIPASQDEANMYACYHVPMADFNIYNS